jgi:sec-independent protein translocase protein TatB
VGIDINGFEFVILVLIGLFIFGPDRLPKVIGDGMRLVRKLRQMARSATDDLGRELGTDIKLEDLNPKALLRKHLLSEEDEAALRKPMEQIWGDMRTTADSLDLTDTAPSPAPDAPAPDALAKVNGRKHVYDVDAT